VVAAHSCTAVSDSVDVYIFVNVMYIEQVVVGTLYSQATINFLYIVCISLTVKGEVSPTKNSYKPLLFSRFDTQHFCSGDVLSTASVFRVEYFAVYTYRYLGRAPSRIETLNGLSCCVGRNSFKLVDVNTVVDYEGP